MKYTGNGKLTIVGGIPKPVGGVTTFIRRLVDKHADKIDLVVDLYPRADKERIPVRHHVVKGGSLLRLFILFLRVRGPVYFNFSGVRGLLLIAVLPKWVGSTWAVTLHNGDLGATAAMVFLRKALVRRGLAKCEFIGVLSPGQAAFFRKMDARPGRMRSISSFVPRDWDLLKPPSPMEFPELTTWVSEGCKIFVISGYPTGIYRHDLVFSVFERLWMNGDRSIRLVAFLYGEDSEGMLSGLRSRFEDAPFSQMYWDKGEEAFLAALNASSGYIRMNTVDSYGVAVAEAISLGKPVLATDVCERFPGASLTKPDDQGAVEAFVHQVVNGDLPGAEPAKRFHDSITDFISEIAKGRR
jgi:glycosyltransferase involved in cell wall biosynthesis